MDKKAQAQILTSVLIIILVLVAIVVVWNVVNSTLSKSKGEIEKKSECLGVNFEIEKIDVSANKVTVMRRAGSDSVIVKSIKFIVAGDGSDISDPAEASRSLKVLETKIYTVGNINTGDKVEIAAILSDDTICSPKISKIA